MKSKNDTKSMSKLNRMTLLGLIAVLTLAGPGPAARATQTYRNKYQHIEVTRFDIQEGVQFPADYLTAMTEELVTQLQETKKFQQVLREGESPAEADAPTIRLTGTVIEFKKGSRAKRYFIGFGAGKTKVKAHIKFIDRTTGEVLFEKDVDGKVIIGFLGGESSGATRGLAKEVAKLSKKQFF